MSDKEMNTMEDGMNDIYTRAQHEKEVTRIEIQSKRWFIAWLVTFAVLMTALIGTNLAWIIYENQFQNVVVTQEVDTGTGDASVTGVGVGDINYGESEADDPGSR